MKFCLTRVLVSALALALLACSPGMVNGSLFQSCWHPSQIEKLSQVLQFTGMGSKIVDHSLRTRRGFRLFWTFRKKNLRIFTAFRPKWRQLTRDPCSNLFFNLRAFSSSTAVHCECKHEQQFSRTKKHDKNYLVKQKCRDNIGRHLFVQAFLPYFPQNLSKFHQDTQEFSN